MPDQDFPATTHSRDSRLARHFSRSLFSSRPSMIRPARFAVAVLLVSTLAIAQNPNASQNAIPTEFNEATIAQLHDETVGQLHLDGDDQRVVQLDDRDMRCGA